MLFRTKPGHAGFTAHPGSDAELATDQINGQERLVDAVTKGVTDFVYCLSIPSTFSTSRSSLSRTATFLM